LAKCVWLCANCHLKLTIKEKHWVDTNKGLALVTPCPCEIIDMCKPAQ